MYNLRGGASLHSTGLKELSAAGQSIRFNWWSIGSSKWFWVKVGDSAVHASTLDPQRLVVCNSWPWIPNSLGTTERAEQSSKVLQSPNYNKIKVVFFYKRRLQAVDVAFHLILRTVSSLSPLGFLYFKAQVTQIPQKTRITLLNYSETPRVCTVWVQITTTLFPTVATCTKHKVLLFVSGDVMASSAILQNHAGRKSRSKFHGEKEGESSRVLQVISAEGSLCVHRQTGSTFITVSSSTVYTYAWWVTKKNIFSYKYSGAICTVYNVMVDVSMVRHLWVCQQNFSIL